MKVFRIKMYKGDRMLRVGIGQNDSIWYIALDLWFVGYRIML